MEQNKSGTEQGNKLILIENFEDFNYLSQGDISLKKLTGLTNEIYMAKNINEHKQKGINTVLFRIFGVAEGLIDQEKEHQIFTQLGELGLGPKCYGYCAGKWRIEEFINEGVHPDQEKLKTDNFRHIMALYLSKFHQSDIKIKEERPHTDSVLENLQLFNNVKEKASKQELYSEEETQQIQQILKYLEKDVLDFMKSIKPNQQKTCVCHNDLNNLNIFYRENKLEQQVLFIDYEYCGFNYVAYDIANFMNEATLNYNIDKDPYFKYEEDIFFDTKDIETFSMIYQYNNQFPKEFANIENIIQNNQNTYSQIQDLLKQKTLEEQKIFSEQQNILIREIEASRIIAQWYWALWSILTCKPEIKMDFNHLDHGIFRIEQYELLKERYLSKYAKNN